MIWATVFLPLGVNLTVSDSLWFAGALTVIFISLQCAFVAFDAVRRVAHASAQRSREANLLEVRLKAARKKRDVQQQQVGAWDGWRKFTIAMRVPESADVCSFYLKPHDGKPLPPFKPGQYLTFQLQIPGQPRPVVRCYSLSDSMHEDYYRVSIRRVGRGSTPPGLSSCFFHDQLKEGEIVDVKAPSGKFYLDLETTHPAVLLSSGIGVTPVLSMLNALVAEGRLDRQVYFFYGVANGTEYSFRDHLDKLSQLHEKLLVHTCFSRPFEHEAEGKDYHTKGRLTIDVLKKVLPSNNFHYYLCGPPAMMESLIEDLKAWGVPTDHIHSEAFGGPAKKAIATATGNNPPPSAAAEAVKHDGIVVQFARSGKKETWKPENGSLLEFAESHQVTIDCACRAGSCGTCKVAIKKGEVTYQAEPSFAVETGSCLTCCSVPKGELVLDA